MRIVFVTIFLIINICNGEETVNSSEDFNVIDLTEIYRNETYNFFVDLYKSVAHSSNLNFVFSPRSVWLMLAAIAEGSNEETQNQLFELLHLPNDLYKRYKFYQLMTSRVIPSNGVSLVESRTLFADENLSINQAWMNIVTKNSLLDVISVPMQNNPVFTTNLMKRLTTANPRIDLSGNSVLLDTIDYNGVWETEFDDAVVENASFYNQEGEEVGTIELMKMKRRAKLGYVKSLKAKVLVLPVGSNERYQMIFVMLLEKKPIKSIVKNINSDIIYEMFGSLEDTLVPIDIAIPRVKVISEIDMREILKDFSNLWTNPEATQHISTPPAFPTSYIQRASLTFNKYGIEPAPVEENPPPDTRSRLDAEIGIDFIVNQPIMCGLFDLETHTPLIALGMSKPTVYNYGTTFLRNI